MMSPERLIHHLVLCVTDLAAAREAYRRLGFTLTPRAAMPFGTANSLVQLQGNYLELLAVADAAAIPQTEQGHLGFGAYNADFLRRREGMSMLMFATDDAARDQALFAAAGLQTYPPVHFSRLATLPDGSRATVAFTLTFVTDPRLPEAMFACCQEHAPEHFWKPDYQRHANGANLATEVVMRAEDPHALADFFGRLTGPATVTRRGSGLVIKLNRGRITVLTPADFAARFPGASLPFAPATPHFAAYRVGAPALDRAEAVLRGTGVAYRRHGTGLQVLPEHAFGIALEFVEA